MWLLVKYGKVKRAVTGILIFYVEVLEYSITNFQILLQFYLSFLENKIFIFTEMEYAPLRRIIQSFFVT